MRVGSIQAGQPLVIQVYDPAWVYTEDFCNNVNMPTDLQQNNIPNLTVSPWNITNVVPSGPGNITRYGMSGAGQSINSNGTRWCTGDQNAGGAAGNLQNTSYIIREPDLTPWSDTDNPIVSQGSCQPSFFRGINQPLQLLLDPTNAAPDAVYVKNYFHRWATVCSVPAANVVLGDYIVQVKTNSSRAGSDRCKWHVPNVGKPLHGRDDRQLDRRRRLQPLCDACRLRHELRCHRPASERHRRLDLGDDEPADLRQCRIGHHAELLPRPHHAHRGLGPHVAAEPLRLGDVGNGSVDVHIVPPPDASTPFSSCTISVDNGSPATFTSSELHDHGHDERRLQRTACDCVDPDPTRLQL